MNATPAQLQRIADQPGITWAGKKVGQTVPLSRRRVLIELRLARLRCQTADTDLAWVEWMLSKNNISTEAALDILDTVMGGSP